MSIVSQENSSVSTENLRFRFRSKPVLDQERPHNFMHARLQNSCTPGVNSCSKSASATYEVFSNLTGNA